MFTHKRFLLITRAVSLVLIVLIFVLRGFSNGELTSPSLIGVELEIVLSLLVVSKLAFIVYMTKRGAPLLWALCSLIGAYPLYGMVGFSSFILHLFVYFSAFLIFNALPRGEEEKIGFGLRFYTRVVLTLALTLTAMFFLMSDSFSFVFPHSAPSSFLNEGGSSDILISLFFLLTCIFLAIHGILNFKNCQAEEFK